MMIHQQLFPPKHPLLPHIYVTSENLFELYRSFHVIPLIKKCAASPGMKEFGKIAYFFENNLCNSVNSMIH